LQIPATPACRPKIKWTLPEGITAGDIQWPAAARAAGRTLVNYGYDGEVLLLTELRSAAAPTSTKPLQLAARADCWSARHLHTRSADLTLALPSSPTARPDPRWAAPIEARVLRCQNRSMAGKTLRKARAKPSN
jgi:thiol:disulfide interchange protein DsbD